jgi:hypothetical protein
MARRDTLIRQLEPMLEPGEWVSHVFVGLGGERRPNHHHIVVLALTDRNVVQARATHMARWVVTGPIERRPREPFPDLPRNRWNPFGMRWRSARHSLWLDGQSRREAHRANASLAGPVDGG